MPSLSLDFASFLFEDECELSSLFLSFTSACGRQSSSIVYHDGDDASMLMALMMWFSMMRGAVIVGMKLDVLKPTGGLVQKSRCKLGGQKKDQLVFSS